ncbi:Dos2-interacting transcription regulator of RNA-Pol-II-domain-containing protein [Hypoxylon sp. FL0890]|nr:Dos2-interacting transcription regulator of RNA-Pol-II-domain-containing protein [Hypoxylon sp. FL0890]
MANVRFEDLALQYVLADESEQEQAIAEQTATAIQESTNSRITLGQWVASINRWIHPVDDSDDDNFVTRAKALDFLASTLGVLNRRNVSILKADQVQLLVTFFGSLFLSDHKAGITASTKALRHLVGMKTLQPTLGNDILDKVSQLGEDFKLQTPATRLEIYELFLELLQNPAVANDLEYRHGNTCGFATSLLDLCRNERDPQNLLKWFEILKIFLQNFSPSEDVTSEVFRTYSAYFPISLRAAATPSGITVDDLKNVLRSCFAAHYRVASFAIPYLINKLDQGDAVTVAVKVDILQTLDACLIQYEHPKQSVVPFVDQIWGSLKYEVRNGEIPDTIKATLKVIRSLTSRLDEEELRSFLADAWRDLVDDLSNPTYTAQAGRLLVAIAGAGFQSFATITSQAIPHLQSTLRHTQSASHKQELVALLNSILAVRSHLIETLKDDATIEKGSGLLKDELFGDALFAEVFLPLWEQTSGAPVTTETVGTLKKIMEGLAALVGQQSSDSGAPRRLCSDSTCERIFGWLAGPSVIYPLEGKQFNEATPDANQDLRDAAVAALKEAVPLYPSAFQLLLEQYLSSLKVAYQQQLALHDLPLEIKLVASTLSEIGCSGLSGRRLMLTNPVSLINVLLEGLLWMLSEKSPPRYWTAFICSIHISVVEFLETLLSQIDNSPRSKPQDITKEWYTLIVSDIQDSGAPRLDSNSPGNLHLVVKALGALEPEEVGVLYKKLLAYSLAVVGQLYRRFTTVNHQSDEATGNRPQVGLSKDFEDGSDSIAEQDTCLHQLGRLATSVVRVLNENEQKTLGLGKDAFILFHQTGAGNDAPQIDLPVETAVVSPLDEFRTAPLSMGVLQGLYPGVLSSECHLNALKNLCAVLTSKPSPCSDTTRAALDTTFTILSNKLRVEDNGISKELQQIQQNMINTLDALWEEDGETGQVGPIARKIFCSVLHFLAGDVARFRSGPEDLNTLFEMVCYKAPKAPTMGCDLSRQFGILVSPKECLEKENHAILKRLSGGWVYARGVQPYLKDCFPKLPFVHTDVVTSRAIAVFAILQYLKYEQYACDVDQIVRIGNMFLRWLSVYPTGSEMESCISVLLKILEKSPETIQEHLAGLISGMILVYEEYRKSPQGISEAEQKKRVMCRKLALEFFQRLPKTYEERHLLPHCQKLLRPLSVACGDPVREVRRTALAARKAWEGLA